jgi:ABC-type transporter Mla subunit MlaD
VRLDLYHHFPGEVLDLLTELAYGVNDIMATQEELASALDQLTTQANKILNEVSTTADALRAQIAALEAALANAGGTTPAVDAALDGLRASLNVLDNLNPDA